MDYPQPEQFYNVLNSIATLFIAGFICLVIWGILTRWDIKFRLWFGSIILVLVFLLNQGSELVRFIPKDKLAGKSIYSLKNLPKERWGKLAKIALDYQVNDPNASPISILSLEKAYSIHSKQPSSALFFKKLFEKKGEKMFQLINRYNWGTEDDMRKAIFQGGMTSPKNKEFFVLLYSKERISHFNYLISRSLWEILEREMKSDFQEWNIGSIPLLKKKAREIKGKAGRKRREGVGKDQWGFPLWTNPLKK